MKIYCEETKPVTRTILVKRLCDLCGKEGKGEDWERGTYEVNQTEISIKIHQKEGHSYPEGGMGTEFEIDLCPNCFKDKLIPWLQSQGAKINKLEWDW